MGGGGGGQRAAHHSPVGLHRLPLPAGKEIGPVVDGPGPLVARKASGVPGLPVCGSRWHTMWTLEQKKNMIRKKKRKKMKYNANSKTG